MNEFEFGIRDEFLYSTLQQLRKDNKWWLNTNTK